MCHDGSPMRYSKDFKLKEDKKRNKVKNYVASKRSYQGLISEHDEFAEYRSDTEVVAHRISQRNKLKLVKCNLKIKHQIFRWP